MRRMCLQCTITKSVEIIRRIQVCPIQELNFDSKENGGKKSISPKIKALKLCIHSRKMCLQGPIIERMEIMTRIQVCPFWWINFDFKENDKQKSFSHKIKASKSCIPMKRTCLLIKINLHKHLFPTILMILCLGLSSFCLTLKTILGF